MGSKSEKEAGRVRDAQLDQVMLRPSVLGVVFDLGKTVISERCSEMEEWIAKGRYPKTSVIRDGNIVRINRYAFHDFMANRQRLKQKNAAKFVEPYNPTAIAAETGYIRILPERKE